MANYEFTELENKLMKNIMNNNIEGVYDCISQGVNVNCHDDCDSPIALAFGKPEILLTLIAAGAKPDLVVKGSYGNNKCILNDFGYLFIDDVVVGNNVDDLYSSLKILKHVVELDIPRETYYEGKLGIDEIISRGLNKTKISDEMRKEIQNKIDMIILEHRTSWTKLFTEIFPEGVPKCASSFLEKDTRIFTEKSEFNGYPATRIINTESLVRYKLEEYIEKNGPFTFGDMWLRTFIQVALATSAYPDQIPVMGRKSQEGIEIPCGDFYFYGEINTELVNQRLNSI